MRIEITSLISLVSLIFSDVTSGIPYGNFCFPFETDGLEKLVRRQQYGLPAPVHRYVLVPPLHRPAPSTSSSSPSPSATNSVTGGYIPHAMTYSPFNSDSSCKSASQVLGDIAIIASKHVQSVRIYATECNTLYTVVPALKQYGLKLIQGLYMTSAGVTSIDSQVNDFTTWLSADNSNTALVEMLIVGNEAVVNVILPPYIPLTLLMTLELGFRKCVTE